MSITSCAGMGIVSVAGWVQFGIVALSQMVCGERRPAWLHGVVDCHLGGDGLLV